MEFYNGILNKEISLFNVDDFNIENWYDASLLKNIFKCLFSNNDLIFLSFRREENLTDEKELDRLRIKVIETFKKEGEYVVLNKLDETRFDSVARINVNDHTFEFIFDVWKYFYSCTFFIPIDQFTFSEFIFSEKQNKFHDIGNEKLLTKKFTNFTCIKDLGGNGLIISYQKNYQLPDLKKAALDTPNIRQTFR